MLNIPTTQEVVDSNISNYENKLGQDAPINPKAFLRVQSVINAQNFTQLYKFGTERAEQNLATTASGEDLENIGSDNGVNKNPAIATVLTADLPAVDGTIISPTKSFVSILTGIRYDVQSQVVAAGGVAALTLVARDVGADGNLDIGSGLTIDSPVPGANTEATVTAISITGTNEEDEEDYRVRVLDAIRESGGGGNSSDYRGWAQEVAGVRRAYPFAGKPESSLAESSPPDRTVYIEATSDIDPEGIAPQGLLDQVRDSITTDPETGRARQPLGLTDETLFVESITRTGFFVEIRGLLIDANLEAQAKQQVEDALQVFFFNLESFVDGLTPDFDRNDLITDLIISGVVDDVLRSLGGSASGVGFGTSSGNFTSVYRLAPGELSKLEQVDFV